MRPRPALGKAATRPATSLGAWKHFGAGLGRTALDVGKKIVGKTPDHSVDEPKDLRFADPAWKDSPFFYGLHRGYQVHRDLLHDLVQSGGLEGRDAAKAEFAAGLVADTLAPTNLLLTNPAALKRIFETGGLSALRGVRNFARDLVTNEGWPSQVDRRPFRLGETIATTPGKVVFRNALIELLQYEPQTDDVNEIPLLVCPPWINRYYVADIAPGKSLIEWAVRHGHTTFAISYRNPDASDRDVTFDDYVRLGPLAALEVARSIADADSVNLLSICLGGTMSAAVVAYLDACQRQVVNTATYINSAIDYEDAGILASVFTDPRTVNELERRTRKDGFLPGKDLAHTFDLLRANDLVFRCLVDRWLLGKDPPAFDLLAWNADSTNLPGKAHAYFIRKMYGKNALARDKLKVLGERLMVSKISIESYIVAALEDHIVPWRSSYRTTQIFKGPLRFVLTSGGTSPAS